MPTSTITVAGNSVTLVPLPTNPAPRSVEPWISDAVALVVSPFTGQTQAQGASGADLHGVTVTYPPLTPGQAAPILAWLAQMRGMARAVQLTPQEYRGPCGSVDSHSAPVASTSGSANAAGSTTLVTRGWKVSSYRLLQPWDLIQVGYRLHRVLDPVDTDGSGNASFEVFPSLRETVADGTALVVRNPLGLYRLAQNKRQWSIEADHFTALSFQLLEYR